MAEFGPGPIPPEVSLVAHEERGSFEQLRNLVGVFATLPCISIGEFRQNYVKMWKDSFSAEAPDPVIANLAYIEGRRSRPVLPSGVSDEQFIGLFFNA